MRAVRRWIRLMGPFGAIAVLGTWNGCRVFQRSDLSPQRLELSVRNNSYFDVDVYVVQSASGSVVRAGTVTGNSSSTLRVRVTDLQPGGLLAVRLHAIGSNRMWTSPSVSVVE